MPEEEDEIGHVPSAKDLEGLSKPERLVYINAVKKVVRDKIESCLNPMVLSNNEEASAAEFDSTSPDSTQLAFLTNIISNNSKEAIISLEVGRYKSFETSEYMAGLFVKHQLTDAEANQIASEVLDELGKSKKDIQRYIESNN